MGPCWLMDLFLGLHSKRSHRNWLVKTHDSVLSWDFTGAGEECAAGREEWPQGPWYPIPLGSTAPGSVLCGGVAASPKCLG